jgi:hypothetical protein
MIELLLQAERSLGIGALDQAERLYWQAIDADSQNAIAIVGLAKVARLRGDDRTAIAFGRRALKVDAENAVARRLVAELEAAHPEDVRAHAPAAEHAAPPSEPSDAPAAQPAAAAAPAAAPAPSPTAGEATAPETAPAPAPAPETAPPAEPPPPADPGTATRRDRRADLDWPAADLKQVRPPLDR